MANRREERERLREIRREAEKRESQEQRRRLMIGYLVAGVLGLAVIAGIVIVIANSGGGGGGASSGPAHISVQSGSTNGIPPDERAGTEPPPTRVLNLKQAAKQAGCVLRLHLPDEGHTHVTTPVKYGTNPPTSGNHNPIPQADGAYLKMPPDTAFVHSLEHGRMEIQYDPKLPEAVQLQLKGLYDTEYAAALLFPNPKMPYAVAATTWTNMLGCKTYKGAITLDAIRDFGRLTWGTYGGEPVDAFGPITGPTPADPSIR
jgi:hypothetical protein